MTQITKNEKVVVNGNPLDSLSEDIGSNPVLFNVIIYEKKRYVAIYSFYDHNFFNSYVHP